TVKMACQWQQCRFCVGASSTRHQQDLFALGCALARARRVVAAGTLPAGEPRPRGESAANDILQSEPRGDRTHDPRLKRPGQLVARGGRDSQAVAMPGHSQDDDSTRHQGLAGFPRSFAAPLLTVREVAAFLCVSTRTAYTL